MADLGTDAENRSRLTSGFSRLLWRWAPLALVSYFIWFILGRALFMPLMSDSYVLDSLSGWEWTWSSAMTTAIQRSDGIIPALASRIRSDSSVMVRARAASCCRRISQFSPEADNSLKQIAVPALRDALNDPSILVQVYSARALWRIERNKDGIALVVKYAWRSNVRDAVNDVLSDLIIDSTEDPDPLIRQQASDAIAAITGRR
jgi:hypothetical protein